MRRQYRQGDVLLCAVDSIPRGAKRLRKAVDRVVGGGELSGYAHACAASGVRMLREEGSHRSFLVIGKGGARLCHEEHHPILVPEGRYELRHQREYTPEMPRHVRD